MPVMRCAAAARAAAAGGVNREIVHALLGLLDQRVAKRSQVSSSARPPTFSNA
jgi:hypothetical protein